MHSKQVINPELLNAHTHDSKIVFPLEALRKYRGPICKRSIKITDHFTCTSVNGRFPFTKNFGKFLLRISVREERVPFVASSIRGGRGRPGRLKDRERYGTGDKDKKSVNGTQISIGKFPPGKRDYLFRNSVYSGKFLVERTKKSCSVYIPTRISGIVW